MTDKARDRLLLDQQLCFALYASSRAVIQSYQPYLASMKLTYPQYLVMLVLWEGDGMSVKAIGERLMLDSGTLTPLLKRLEAHGYLSRDRSAEDERQLLVRLTDTGHALRGAALDMRSAMQCRFAGLLGEADGLRDTLHELLQQLLQHGPGIKADNH